MAIDPDDLETWQHALVRVWTLLPLAPATLQGTYGTLPETDIVAAVGGDAPVPLDLVGCQSDEERLVALGAGYGRL